MLEEIKILHETEKSRIILLRDSETKKKVIRKELRGNHSLYKKLKEYKHPYLPEIYSVEDKDGKTIILEEYIEGVSLDRAFLSERILTRCFLEMCQVLDFLHSRHILHRDIKPEHILLAPDHHIRLIDFDAAREPKAEASQDTCLLGTKGYAAPEQYGFSQTDERADIYSLGITFQTLLGPVARKKRWRKLLRKCTDMDPKDVFLLLIRFEMLSTGADFSNGVCSLFAYWYLGFTWQFSFLCFLNQRLRLLCGQCLDWLTHRNGKASRLIHRKCEICGQMVRLLRCMNIKV